MNNLRTPEYLSPSSLATFERDPAEFFYKYIVPKDIRPERPPQTDPMAVGSAFDALVKSQLYQDFYGFFQAEVDGYTRRKLVESQCEPHTLPEALVIASDCFEQYVECGAYDALYDLMTSSAKLGQAPRMEFDVEKRVEGVPLLGKPDLHFHTPGGCHFICDWKVSGSVSKCGVSPQQGYQIVRSINGGRGEGKPHIKYVPMYSCGVLVNAVPMNDTTDYWADQLATYAWCLGERVGSQEFICRIEQLACRPCPATDETDRLRVKCAVHQSTVDHDYQVDLISRYQRCWYHVSRGHYFPELTKSDSDAQCELLLRELRSPTILPPDLSKNDVQPISFGGNNDVQ